MLAFIVLPHWKYHALGTWHDTTLSHIIMTLGRPVLTLSRKSECQAKSILTTLECRGRDRIRDLPFPEADTLPTELPGRYTDLSQLMRLWYLSHRRPAKAQASLHIRAVSPEPSLFAHMKNGSRRKVGLKIRQLRLRAWRISLRRTKSAIISWAFHFISDGKVSDPVSVLPGIPHWLAVGLVLFSILRITLGP